MYEPEEKKDYSGDSREKLQDIRHRSDEAQQHKALERRDRAIAEGNRPHASNKVIAPIIMAMMIVAALTGIYLIIDNMDFERRNLMLDSAAFRDASERVMQSPNILKVSFQQKLENVQQIRMTLYIDYTVVDEQAKKMGSEVVAMLATAKDGASIEDDQVGSGRYNYLVIMSRLGDREVARGVMAAGSQRVIWE